MLDRYTPPTLRYLVRTQHDTGTMFHNIPALTLTNLLATTLREHFARQDDTLLALLRTNAIHIIDQHMYKQAYCDFIPYHTHVFLLSRLNLLWKNCITSWPQLLFSTTTSSILLKSCKVITTLEGVRDPLSVPIRLLATILSEPLNTIHNRLPITKHTFKQATPPTKVNLSYLPLLLPYLLPKPSLVLTSDIRIPRPNASSHIAPISRIDSKYLPPSE
jgi:hypothetical protein